MKTKKRGIKMSLFGNVQKPVPDYIFDSEIAMNATGRYNSFDIGKFCWRTDEDKIYFLKSLIDPDTPNAIPTWVIVGGGGGSELIQSIPVTYNGEPVFFDNIPQTFRHLELRYSCRSQITTFADFLLLELNGDSSGVNYRTNGWESTFASGITPVTIGGLNFIARINGDSSTFNKVSHGVIKFNDYTNLNTVKQAICEWFSPSTNIDNEMVSGRYDVIHNVAPAPITQIAITNDSTGGGYHNFPDISRFDLYGY